MVKLGLFLCLFFSAIAQANVSSSLDRQQMYANETVTLTIESDDSHVFSSPDVSALESSFIIQNQSKSSQSSWINGKSQSSTTWSYVLKPKHAGVLTIPAISLGKQQTQALSLMVKQPQYSAGSSSDPVFLQASVDKKSVHVGQQVVLTIRVNRAIQVSDLSLTPPTIANAKVIKAKESQYQRQINSKLYVTHEISYSIFPEQSGNLTIPAIQATVVVPQTQMDLFMQQGNTHYLTSQPITISVSPAIADISADSLVLQESWSKDPSSLKVGDSITRTIEQKASGTLAENLADIAIAEQPNMRVYAEKPKLDNQMQNHSNQATRTDQIAIVVTKAGTITLPPITITWLNNQSQQKETASLPAITLKVAGDPNASSTATSGQTATAPNSAPKAEKSAEKTVEKPAPSQPASQAEPSSVWLWQLLSLALLILASVLGLLLLIKKSRAQPPTPVLITEPEQALKALQRACKDNNQAAISQALLAWARLHWPKESLYSLADVKRLLNQSHLAPYFSALDKGTAIDWSDFINVIQTLSQQKQQKSLYPTQ